MEPHFFTKIDSNSVVLTPNRRLSTHLLSSYDNWQIQQGKSVWPTAKILPIQTWLESLWQQSQQASSLLTPYQELQLWQNAISLSDYTDDIIDIESAARLAQQAWSYLVQWQKSLNAIQEFNNIEINAFTTWATHYQQQCKKLNSIDRYQMLNLLMSESDQLLFPNTIYLAGFDEIVPQQQQLLTLSQATLITITPTQHATTQLISLETDTDEIKTMLRWAKAIHVKQPEAKITCVIPNLEMLRSQLVHHVNQVFFPEAMFNSEYNQNTVNISGGYPLNQTDIIKAAMLLLRLSNYQIDFQELSLLLNNDYITGADTRLTQRALLDNHLRHLNEPTLTWKLVINTICEYQQEYQVDYGNDFITLIENYINVTTTSPKLASHKQWHSYYLQLLAIFDWPGPRSLSSREYQQVKRFYEALDEFSQLDITDNAINFKTAQQQLQQLMANTLFQEQTINGPIQILGLLEAGGLESDYIWLMGLNSNTWPAPANPNPFIPLHLQRQWDMPHSTAERELHFSKTLQQRFITSCQQLICSYAQFDGERELQASTLLNDFSEITVTELTLSEPPSIESDINHRVNLVNIDDDCGPAITSDEVISGGTGIFKAQAACPFQAFARYRLHAYSIPIPQLHLSAAERGQLLHFALDSIWKILGSQKKLIAYSEQKLITLVDASIHSALEKTLPYYSKKIKSRFKSLEKKRLQQLLINWLAIEKQRPEFIVIAHEKWRKTTFGKLTLHMQIDRIDKLANQQQVVIDYKTGMVNLNGWFNERLKEPQLPLYCTTSPEIKAISFAEIRSDKLAFKGVSGFETEISGINNYSAEDWQQLVNDWHSSLTLLADEFNQGLATVTPEPDACTYCDLASLCRINEVI